MKHLAAYLLLILGGNEKPSAEDVKAVITAVGGDVDEEKLNTLITDLEGKDIHELLAKGDSDLKSVVGVGGGSSSAVPTTSGSATAAPAAAPVVEKPKEEEVDALDGGMDMFGGGGGGSDY